MSDSLKIQSRIRDYEVTFATARERIAADVEEPCAVLVDARVRELYGDWLDDVLKDRPVFEVRALESNKNLDFSQSIIRWLLEQGFKRTHLLVAIGGGITQDLACFTASVLFRGVRWAFHPTTLLAQCDSCIGSKSSINVGPYKNQVGTFFPPERINVDVGFIGSLEHQDILSGLGEAIKVHFLDAERRYERIFELYEKALTNPKALEAVVRDSLVIKKRVIELDEFDTDYRNIMNYGHTFGHALESVTDYALPHGIAVTAGMGVANYVSRALGHLTSEDHDRMESLIRRNIGDTRVRLSSLEAYWEALARDKKNVDQNVTCILTRGFGEMFRTQLALDEPTKRLIQQAFDKLGILTG